MDIVYNLQLHATFTDETFHVTETISGTWSNALGAGGHFVSQSSQQGPGYPIYAETSVLTVTGVSPTGERVQLRLLFHITIDANGDVTSFVEDANC